MNSEGIESLTFMTLLCIFWLKGLIIYFHLWDFSKKLAKCWLAVGPRWIKAQVYALLMLAPPSRCSVNGGDVLVLSGSPIFKYSTQVTMNLELGMQCMWAPNTSVGPWELHLPSFPEGIPQIVSRDEAPCILWQGDSVSVTEVGLLKSSFCVSLSLASESVSCSVVSNSSRPHGQ